MIINQNDRLNDIQIYSCILSSPQYYSVYKTGDGHVISSQLSNFISQLSDALLASIFHPSYLILHTSLLTMVNPN